MDADRVARYRRHRAEAKQEVFLDSSKLPILSDMVGKAGRKLASVESPTVSTVSSRNNKRKRTTASASPPALPRGAHSTPSDTDSNHDLFGPSAFDRYDMDDFNDDEDDTTEARAMVNLGRNKITTSDGPSLPSTPYEPLHHRRPPHFSHLRRTTADATAPLPFRFRPASSDNEVDDAKDFTSEELAILERARAKERAAQRKGKQLGLGDRSGTGSSREAKKVKLEVKTEPLASTSNPDDPIVLSD